MSNNNYAPSLVVTDLKSLSHCRSVYGPGFYYVLQKVHEAASIIAMQFCDKYSEKPYCNKSAQSLHLRNV